MTVVFITGCSSGLGKALARLFHKQKTYAGKPASFRVYATARKLQSIEDLRLEGINVVQLDVTNTKSIQEAVNRVDREAGGIDVLICNAGIACLAPILEQDLSEIEAVWSTNIMGPLLCARAVAPIMMRQRSGVMAVTGSLASEISAPFNGAYSSSKAAVTRMFDTIRLEVAPFNISVCVVEAAFFSSNLMVNTRSGSQFDVQKSSWSRAANALDSFRNIEKQTKNAMSSEEIAKIVVAKICQKGGPPPRFLLGTQAWLYKLFAFIYSYLAPGFVHQRFLAQFGLNQKW